VTALKLAKMEELKALQAERDRRHQARLSKTDVFEALGYTPEPKQRLFHDAVEFDVLYGGAAGGGKGGRCPDRTAPSYNSSLETKVLTPKGFKLIGDIAIGDQVCNPDGGVAHVIRITDNGPKQFYRVTLDDGSTVEADEDHLWAVSITSHRKRRKTGVPVIPDGLRPEDEWNLRVQSRARIVSTAQLRELVRKADDESARGMLPHHVQLPLTNPVNLTGARGRWERFSAYILGALVGDGSFGNGAAVTICGLDEPVFERIRAELPAHLQLIERAASPDRSCPQYAITRRVITRDIDSTAVFVKELARLMAARGWRQADLVRASGFTQAYLSAICTGRQRPSLKLVEALDALLDGEGALVEARSRHAGAAATDLLRRDGLLGCHSWDKFIPERIQVAPAGERFAFMQGLMDTDGYMDDRGHVEFVTVSEQLARDTQGVLRSLGYKATLSTKQPYCTHKGEKRAGRLAYRLYIRGRHMDRLFHMPRKRERVQQFNGGHVEPWHRVVSVEPTEVDNSRCITVDNLNHLYVTDDYIVTHNSVAIVAEGIRAAIRHPGLRILLVRRTYDELAESIWPVLRKFGYAETVGGTWNGSEKELRFANGSLFRFRYMDNPVDASRRQGGQYQLLLVDEATLMPPGVVEILKFERLRSGEGLPVLGCRATCNPGGPSHAAVKDRYIEPTEYGSHPAVDDNGMTIRFIQAKATDNPHLDDGYRRRLDSIPDPNRRAAMRDGDWDRWEGQMFAELSRDRHVLAPITLPAEWRRYNGIDWGFAKPWCVLWAAVDEDGRVWVYREIYETQVGEAEQAVRILAAEADGEHIVSRYADDAMWATRGDAKPIAQVYADHGVYLTAAGKGPGSRVIGWQRLHSYLAEGPACAHHRAHGWATCPMLHMFSTCPRLYGELKDLPHATRGDPEDADTNAPDHAADGLRYLLVNLDTGPEFTIFGEEPDPMAVRVTPAMAVVPRSNDPVWDVPEDDDARPGATAVSPFA